MIRNMIEEGPCPHCGETMYNVTISMQIGKVQIAASRMVDVLEQDQIVAAASALQALVLSAKSCQSKKI